MKQPLTLEQIAELPLVRDFLMRQVAGSNEAQRAERLQMLKALRDTEAECAKIDAEAEVARHALDVAQKAWESARGTCGAIAAKRTAAGARYQRAHKRLLELGERTIEDAARKIGAFKDALGERISTLDRTLKRDAGLRPHEAAARMKTSRRRQMATELNAHRDALEQLAEALVTVEGMRHTEMPPGEIVEHVAAIIERIGLDGSNITGLEVRQAA